MAILIFLTTNISCAIIVDEQEKNYNSVPIKFLIIRVSINDTLFLIVAIVLSICIYKMSRMSSANVVLEAKVIQFFVKYKQIYTVTPHNRMFVKCVLYL